MNLKPASIFTVACIALHGALPAYAQSVQQPPDPTAQWSNCSGPGPWHTWGGGWHFGGMFALMLIIFIVGLVIVLVANRYSGTPHAPMPWHMMHGQHWPLWNDPAASALKILNERYARGEIMKEEYEEKKAALQAGGPR